MAASPTRSVPRSLANLFALPVSDCVMARSLAANVAESIAIPAGVKYVMLSANVDIFVSIGAAPTAAVPGDTTDGSASELNPTMRRLQSTDLNISVISASAGIVTASFYAESTP